MHSSSGLTRCTVAVSPPTMNTSSAACAPHCAPDTGASTTATPVACSAAAVSRVIHGCADEVSSNKAPGFKVCTRPRGPSVTSRTTSPFGSIVMTMSLLSPTAAGVSTAQA